MGELVGSCFFIPPQGKGPEAKKGHFIGCLFTSVYKGKRKDGPEEILVSTKKAVEELVREVEGLERGGHEVSAEGENQDDDGGENGSKGQHDEGESGDDGDKKHDDNSPPKTSSKSPITSVRTCKINSGLFNVEWERTVDILHGIDIPDGHPLKKIEVWEREE
jgi:hypothetical protein